MTSKTTTRYEDLTKAQLKRLATVLVARSLIVAVLLFALLGAKAVSSRSK